MKSARDLIASNSARAGTPRAEGATFNGYGTPKIADSSGKRRRAAVVPCGEHVDVPQLLDGAHPCAVRDQGPYRPAAGDRVRSFARRFQARPAWRAKELIPPESNSAAPPPRPTGRCRRPRQQTDSARPCEIGDGVLRPSDRCPRFHLGSIVANVVSPCVVDHDPIDAGRNEVGAESAIMSLRMPADAVGAHPPVMCSSCTRRGCRVIALDVKATAPISAPSLMICLRVRPS